MITTKRIALLLLILASIILSTSAVYAGCCVGQTGCTRAFDSSECPGTAPFQDNECEDVDDCVVGICCHDDPVFPHSMYKITCTLGFGPTTRFDTMSDFNLNPTSYESQAATVCASDVLPDCTFLSCEQPNTESCRCGLTNINTTEPYCCAEDNQGFTSLATCQLSSCAAAAYVAISGIIKDSTTGMPVAGATVRAGGKQTISDADGFYRIALLPANSEGTIIVTKDVFSNATSYSLGTVDLELDLYLEIGETAITVEDCDTPGDQDGDQFGGGLGLTDLNMLDTCDADCGVVEQTVLPAFYEPGTETRCDDRLDNDCDGVFDYDDEDCFLDTTICGDGEVQFPNGDGVFEQCDAISYDDFMVPEGIDDRCPGLCNVSNCQCIYTAGCGNGIIDEPDEDCDGFWDPVHQMWDPFSSVTGCETPSDCFTPLDSDPCVCRQGNVCGDSVLQYPPEQCEYDAGAYDELTGQIIDYSAVQFAPGLGCIGFNEETNPVPCSPSCQCIIAPTCGNGVIEGDEECDGTWNPMTSPNVLPSPLTLGTTSANAGYWTDFSARKFGCTVNICGGVAEPSEPYSVTYSRPDEDDQTFEVNPCRCPVLCDINPVGPNLTSVKAVTFSPEIDIEWKDECRDNAQRYYVHRCDTEACTSSFAISGELPSEAFQFTDIVTQEHVPYCYRIEGVYETKTIGVSHKFSNVMCITSGDEECFTFHDLYPEAKETCAFENKNVRATCDDNNTLIFAPWSSGNPYVDCNNVEIDLDGDGAPDMTEEYVCVVLYEGRESRCIPKSICDRCSDPLGVFSYSFGLGSEGDAVNYGVSVGFDREGTSSRKRPCYELFGCFLDYSRSSVDKFMPYALNFSCYDYNSEMACREDAKFLGNCEWINATRGYYAQVGFGVCRPNVTAEEDCHECHNPLNKLFGKCSEDTCWLYGHCYYDKDSGNRLYDSIPYADYDPSTTSFYLCQHKSVISCEDYDTEEDCVNSSGHYSRYREDQVFTPVEVDVEGYLEYNDFLKTGGTNAQLNFSDDYFNYTKCQWGSQDIVYDFNDGYENEFDAEFDECFRNADFSPPQVDYDEEQEFSVYDYLVALDCPGGPFSAFQLGCRRDFQNPNTSIPYTDKVSGSFNLTAYVFDDMLDYAPLELPETYSCLVDEGAGPCYPTGYAERTVLGNIVRWNNTNISIPDFNPDTPPSNGFTMGFYDLYFFSEDYAKNLEYPIKYITIFIDPVPPDVLIEFELESWELFEDIWRTNVSMTMDIVNATKTNDSMAVCSASFNNEYMQDMFPMLKIEDEYGNNWSRNYTYITDGVYYFVYRCEDEVGNVKNDSIEIIIDGDKSVTNPQPRGTINYDDVTISVESAKAANCKYEESFYELEEFNGTDFNKEDFDAMSDNFEHTGGMFHSQFFTNLDNGYHRFYVKCQFPDEEPEKQIRGSKADEVRFAVDVEPPVTNFGTSRTDYQGWYNNDIDVSLYCGDPAIVDAVGIQWQYGCANTTVCVGTDCGTFEKYISSITLASSTNITFYSEDAGGNTEEMHENVEFLIDKVLPNVTIEILEPGDTPAEFVRLDMPYKIVVSSDKPLISPEIDKPTLYFTSNPSKFNEEIMLFPTVDPNVWEGLLRLTNINKNRGFEGTGRLKAMVIDHHNVTGEGQVDFLVDTKPPTPPTFKPSIEDPYPEVSEFIEEGYPLKYFNGTYYTNDKYLFLTGFTDELLDIVLAQTSEAIPKEFRFTQFESAEVFSDKAISGVNHKIKIEGDLTESINNEHYVGFANSPGGSHPDRMGPRRAYHHYGEFYDITAVTYIPGVLGADQYTEINLYNSLEEPLAELPANQMVYFYDTAVPSYWFGISLDLEPYKMNDVLMFVYDVAGNIARYPPTPNVFNFFYDPDAPMLLSHYPFAGSTSQQDISIQVRLAELVEGSGIDNTSIEMNLTLEDGTELILQPELILESEDDIFKNYVLKVPEEFYVDGMYTVKVYAEDLAGNPIDNNETPFEWNFAVDSNAPPRPIFEIIKGKPGPEIEPNTGQPTRWYTQQDNPQFSLEFKEDDLVTVSDVVMAHAPSEGEAAACVRDGTIPMAVDTIEHIEFAGGSIHYTLDEGTEMTFMINGTDYKVEVFNLSENGIINVRIEINDELITGIYAGDTYLFGSGNNTDLQFLVEEIGEQDGSYYIEFYMGFGTLEEWTEEINSSVNDTVSIGPIINKFICTFNIPVEVPSMFAWMDYGVIVKSFKTLGDGSTSSIAEYGPFDFTIDHEAPDFNMDFNTRIRDEYNLAINSTVTNEGHPLKGYFRVLGTEYPLAMTGFQMIDYGIAIYSFVWPVPALSKSQEGEHRLDITIEDYAGNSAKTNRDVFIDLTAPRILNLSLDISRILSIGSQYFTRYANITISGTFDVEDSYDVAAIWVEPGTFNMTTAAYEGRTFGYVNYDELGRSDAFEVSVQLRGSEGAEILNNMTIFVMDWAGHITTSSLNVWRDLKAPGTPTFCISDTGICQQAFWPGQGNTNRPFPGQGTATNNNPHGTDKFR